MDPPMNAPIFPAVVSIDDTFGAILVGTFVGLILYGVVLHQSFRYFNLYPDDSIGLKFMVTFILVLETFHMILATHACYWYLVTSFTKPSMLLSGVWSINLLNAVSGCVIIATQSFFTRRVYLLGKRYWVLVIIVILLLTGELAFFISATTQAFVQSWFSDFNKWTWMTSAGAAMAVVADIILTTVLVFLLRNSRTGVESMDSVMDILMLYAINTGLLTSIVNFMSFIFSLLLPAKLIYGAFGLVCTKLYANSLLAALNARKSLTLRAKTDIEANLNSSSIRLTRVKSSTAPNIGVAI